MDGKMSGRGKGGQEEEKQLRIRQLVDATMKMSRPAVRRTVECDCVEDGLVILLVVDL